MSPKAVSEWLCTSYQETDKSCYVSKDSLFSDAVTYFKVQDNTVERRHFFETLGRYVFGKHSNFMTINLKSKKQIGAEKKGKITDFRQYYEGVKKDQDRCTEGRPQEKQNRSDVTRIDI